MMVGNIRSKTIRPDLRLGDAVAFDTVLVKHGHAGTRWGPLACSGVGILVGFRTKQDGQWVTEDDGGWEGPSHPYRVWEPSRFIPCALVVTALNTDPFVVPRESLQRLGVSALVGYLATIKEAAYNAGQSEGVRSATRAPGV